MTCFAGYGHIFPLFFCAFVFRFGQRLQEHPRRGGTTHPVSSPTPDIAHTGHLQGLEGVWCPPPLVFFFSIYIELFAELDYLLPAWEHVFFMRCLLDVNQSLLMYIDIATYFIIISSYIGNHIVWKNLPQSIDVLQMQ